MSQETAISTRYFHKKNQIISKMTNMSQVRLTTMTTIIFVMLACHQLVGEGRDSSNPPSRLVKSRLVRGLLQSRASNRSHPT